jgi:hypothetical protein
MLPCIEIFGAARCQGTSKRTGLPCKNVAAYKSRCCRMHGAVPKPLSGKAHPNFKHGFFSKHGKAEYRRAMTELKKLKNLLDL